MKNFYIILSVALTCFLYLSSQKPHDGTGLSELYAIAPTSTPAPAPTPTSAPTAAEWKILKPADRGKPFDVAAAEFQKYYELCTGVRLDITTEANDTDHLIVIGSDAIHQFVRTAIENKVISPFRVRTGTDDYHILSASDGKRNLLFLAGGRGRATLYAVYHFFEARANCSWFWDGDVVPRTETLDMTGLDIAESPRFEYRGLRYFAHRSLHRFQAEHWGPDDWEREIDWIVKKRLNMFMLRIGMDDVFQKAFPDIVPYPDNDKPLPEATAGLEDRTTFWSLQYRGELRRHILQYAFDRDLMHPEDFGTMTHWYSKTPIAFLETVNPSFLEQSGGDHRGRTGLVWDIRDDKYLDLYFKLTETHAAHYGKPELFHTIGLAERYMFNNRDENLEMKRYTLRRLIAKLREKQPNAPVLLAGWDFCCCWKTDEIPELIGELDPSRTIFWDYEADVKSGHNFTNWGLVGKFPYTFGIFEAYVSSADIRANYDIIEERIAVAANDPFCKGYIYWPETSHADILMLEYFPTNAWQPDQPKPIEALERLCQTRYRSAPEKMETVWKTFLPMTYPNLIGNSYDPQIFTYFSRPDQFFSEKQVWDKILIHYRRQLASAPLLFRMLGELPFDPSEPFLRRDLIDIARTTTKNLTLIAIAELNTALQNQLSGKASPKDVQRAGEHFVRHVELFRDLLSLHEDYSLNATFERLHTVSEVNPCFAKTLVANAANGYCVSYQYELFDHLYLPIARKYVDAANNNAKKGALPSPDELKALQQAYNSAFETVRNTPLHAMKSQKAPTASRYREIMSKLAANADILLAHND